MGLLDLFRPSPKPCGTCRDRSPGLHRVWSGLRAGEETDRLCTRCLLARLGPEVRGKRLLFTEPSIEDSYVFSPLADLRDTGLAAERVERALASLGSTCARCSSRPAHLWLSQDDLDWDAMSAQRRFDYWPIPAEPERWTGAARLCEAHLVVHLSEFLARKRWHFLTFRFPDSSSSGVYW